jgi:cysteine desulfurase/selenocysteine lyase
MGLAAALAFLEQIGMENVEAHSLALGQRFHEGLRRFPDLRLLSQSPQAHYGIASFFVNIPGLSSEMFGRIMADSYGIMLSAGRHCAHPYHDWLGLSSTVRVSTHVYTSEEEVQRFLDAVQELVGPPVSASKEISNAAILTVCEPEHGDTGPARSVGIV